GRRVKFVFLPDGEDPDTFVRKEGKTAFETRLASALTATQCRFQRVGLGLDLQQVDDRARFVALAQPHIELVPDEILKGMMLRELADLVRMPIVEIVKPRAREHRPEARAQRNGPGARISDRLLSIALAHPGFFATLRQPERAGLLGLPNSLLVRVLRVIAEQPTVDQSALLAYFAGDADYDRLVNLANRTFETAGEDAGREF